MNYSKVHETSEGRVGAFNHAPEAAGGPPPAAFSILLEDVN